MKTKRPTQRQKEDDQRYLPGLLRHFHKLGYSLAQCADRRRLNRKPVDLLHHARLLGLVFPDHDEINEQARLKAMNAKK
jgi:hypothetical protein